MPEYIELNMTNYNANDVAQLNEWGIHAVSLMQEVQRKLEEIVVTDGVDKGVILLSQDGPTHYDKELKCQVYDHEHFSPLGDALIELYDMIQKLTEV